MTPWILGIGALIVVAAAVTAMALSQAPATPSGASSTLPPSSASSDAGNASGLPPFTASTGDPAIGQPIPEVDGTSFDGSPVAIATDGKAKILLFLAHWCPHCQREVPVVQSWLDEGKLPAGVELISVATSIDPNAPNYPPDAWLAREGWSAPVIVDRDRSIAARYGLTRFPYWVAVDGDGRVAWRGTGELPPDALDTLATMLTTAG
jgi:cytochrome c biogenesis protein CcmG/thiol:disulfide interchange protein DsbE